MVQQLLIACLKELENRLINRGVNSPDDLKERLEKELRKDEREIQKTESELRLSEQAFDQFLQENDYKTFLFII